MTAFLSASPVLGGPKLPNNTAVCRRPARGVVVAHTGKGGRGRGGGPFRKLRDAILRPIVSVPGSNSNNDLIDCVFCEGTGRLDCDACNGTGKDALGVCMVCDGKGTLECHVCNGVGLVDRVRVGGTDDNRDWAVKNKGIVKGKRKKKIEA